MTIITLANSLVERSVLGIGLASPLTPDDTIGDWQRLEGADNVKACIIDLISTRVGERLMFEDIGTTIPELVFESVEGVLDILPFQLVEVIKRYEPRVIRVACTAEAFSTDKGDGVNAKLSWTLRSTGKRDNLVWPFYLEPPEGGISR